MTNFSHCKELRFLMFVSTSYFFVSPEKLSVSVSVFETVNDTRLIDGLMRCEADSVRLLVYDDC